MGSHLGSLCKTITGGAFSVYCFRPHLQNVVYGRTRFVCTELFRLMPQLGHLYEKCIRIHRGILLESPFSVPADAEKSANW